MEVIRIKIKGIRNIRDISQYKTESGKQIKPKALIRSSRLDKANDKNRSKLFNEYNIKTIIDLRTDIEVSESKKYELPADTKLIHLSLLSESFFGISREKKMGSALRKISKELTGDNIGVEYMKSMYKSIIFHEFSQSQIKRFFELIVENKDGGIVYHCTGGKDRTAIITLCLLTILGVSKEDIIRDYCMSDICNRRYNIKTKILSNMFLFPMPKFKNLLIEMLYSKKEYIEYTIS